VLRVAPGVLRRRASTVAHTSGLGDGGDSQVRDEVRTVLRNFFPVLVGRGVVQLSGYVDNALASLVAKGAVTVFTNAQTLYLLPGTLFGMSIAAAELPAMARLQGGSDEVAALLRARLTAGLRRIAFFIVPSAVAFVAGTLAGSTVGLLASTLGRLYSSTFYALRQTRTPLRFAVLRVALTLGLGYVGARYAPAWFGLSPKWGTAGLTVTSGLAGWVEFGLLRRALNRVIGETGIPAAALAKLWAAAGAAAAVGFSVKLASAALPPLALAPLVLGAFGVTYLAVTAALGEGESAALLARVRRRLGRR
jgi:putative peptidoglycan lipid II flippase